MSADDLGGVLFLSAAVLLVAVAAVRLSLRLGLPSLLVYLGMGLLIGEAGLGISFEDAQLTGALGYAALVLILAEGGLTTRWTTIRPSLVPAASLATLGTVVSIGVCASGVHFLLGLDWNQAMLLGAVVSSTDAAAVFSVLRTVPLPSRLVGLLEAESGFNDAPVVIAVVALTEQVLGHAGTTWWELALLAVAELAGGATVGYLVGRLGGAGLHRVALPSSGLYPITALGLVAFAYGAAVTLHTSGFLAVYVTALVLGNARLPHGAAVRGFAEGLGWAAQIGLFVLLGLLASPSRLQSAVAPALVIALVLLLLARPISVFSSVSWFGVPLREQLFLSWAGLRGAVPVVLTTVPWSAAVAGSERLFDTVFLLVVGLTLVQGPSLPWVARRLGLGNDLNATDLDVESSPLGALNADVLQVRIGPTSRLHGVELFELRLPSRANVTLVVRDGEPFVPSPTTTLRHGDDLIVVTAAAVRATAEERLAAVSREGKLAGWRRPAAPLGGRTRPASGGLLGGALGRSPGQNQSGNSGGDSSGTQGRNQAGSRARNLGTNLGAALGGAFGRRAGGTAGGSEPAGGAGGGR